MSGPTRTDFDAIAKAHARATVVLLRVLEGIQRDPMLRPISDKVFGLLADELAFAAGFERKLSEVADYVEAWRYLCERNGRAPDRAVFEELLADGGPEMVEEPEPVAEPYFADQPTLPPVEEAEPPPVVEEDPGWLSDRERAVQLLRERTVWGREESGGEPAA
jgi:hypothetical protein